MSETEPKEPADQSLIDDLISYDERLANSTSQIEDSEQTEHSIAPKDDPAKHPEDAELNVELDELKQCADLLEQLRKSTTSHNDQVGAESEPFPSVIGHRIGKYVLQDFVGRGAFGVVYRAYDEDLNRDVAIKLPRQEVLFDREKLKRFELEAMAAASLDHPSIVPVMDADLTGDMPYIATAFCDGPDLGEWLDTQQQPVSAEEAARFVAQLADAVEHAHQEGVLHRDLKPGNVLLSPQVSRNSDGAKATPLDSLAAYQPRLTDFGLAKLVEASFEDTRSSLVVGTPLYMAPEQMGVQTGSSYPQTDVYALGVLLYELLTLKTPFDSPSYVEVLDRVRDQEPAPISTINPQVSRDLVVICGKCMRKEPESRYQSASELASDLRRFLKQEPIHARSQTVAERFLRWCTRPERISQAVSLVITLQVLLIGWVLLGALTLGQVLDGDELISDRMHIAMVLFGVHLPVLVSTWLGAKYHRRFFYAALLIVFLGQVVLPPLAVSQSMDLLAASYDRHQYFQLTNFGFVFFAGVAQVLALCTALIASRRRARA